MPCFRATVLSRLAMLVLGALVLLPAGRAGAQRPTAAQILPEDTLLYVRVDDSSDLVKRFKQTAIGRISQDQKIKPLFTQLYGSAVEAFSRIEERIGASLEDLLSVPQGELCLALVAPEQGPPVPVLLIDAGQRLPIVQKLFERIEQLIAERSTRIEERLGDTRLIVHTMSGRRQRQLVYVEREEVVILTANVDVAKTVLKAWADEDQRTLSDNPNFTAIMRRCTGSEAERPQITMYADPIMLFAKATRNDLAAQTTLALFPALGLDGVLGVGGSVTLATDEYDGLTHLHLLLDSPREGIPQMIALKSGDVTPEPWVPSDVVSYITMNWDATKTYSTYSELYDSIRGEGALAASFEADIANQFDIDFREDLLDAITGRATYVAWMVKPARLNSRGNLFGLKLKDAAEFQKTFDKFVSKVGQGDLRSETYAGVTIYLGEPQRPRARQMEDNELTRRPDPAIAILGDYLIMSDSSQLLKHVITTKNEGSGLLADDFEFRLIASKLRRLPGGSDPGMIAFDRPEESLRLVYELANADATRQRLTNRAERNGFFRALDGALRDNPLPPFSAIARYLAPGGSLVTSDETGLHYVNFTLRRK